jgi:hypothetical protein
MYKRWLFVLLCAVLMAGCGPGAKSRLVIEEHLLTAAPDLSTDRLAYHFASGDQDAALAKTAAYRDFRKQYEDCNKGALAPFGYTLKDQAEPAGAGYFSIYHGDRLVAKDVLFMPPVSVNASKSDFIGLPGLSDGTYQFTKERFEVLPFDATRKPYGYVGDKLLSAEISDAGGGASRLRVYLGEQMVYETEFNYVSTYAPMDGLATFGGHWGLALLDAKVDTAQGPQEYDRVILDGKDINSVKGYEQSFEFGVLDGSPFYFYQKGGKIGISFDGQEMAKGYDEVPHYQCCMPSLLNPGRSMNAVWFFARRGSEWYYVEAYVKR